MNATTEKKLAKIRKMTADEAVQYFREHGVRGSIVIRFDGAEASAPVTVDGQSTQFQVADFSHRVTAAVKQFGNSHDHGRPDVVYVVGRYWGQEEGWYTSVSKYIRLAKN
jgi:hypothetical protein